VYVKINGEEIPRNSLSYVIIAIGGGVTITGEAINEQERQTLVTILGGINQGDTVEFDAENDESRRLNGAGEIKLLKTEEEGVGGLMRIKYTIVIQYVK